MKATHLGRSTEPPPTINKENITSTYNSTNEHDDEGAEDYSELLKIDSLTVKNDEKDDDIQKQLSSASSNIITTATKGSKISNASLLASLTSGSHMKDRKRGSEGESDDEDQDPSVRIAQEGLAEIKRERVYTFEEVEKIRNYYQRKIEDLARKSESKLRLEKRRNYAPNAEWRHFGTINGQPGEIEKLKAENEALKARVEEMQMAESAYVLGVLNENEIISELRRQVEQIPHWAAAFERQEAEVTQLQSTIEYLRSTNGKLEKQVERLSTPLKKNEIEQRIADIERRQQEREKALQTIISDLKIKHQSEMQLLHEKFKQILQTKDAELSRFRLELKKITTKLGFDGKLKD